MCFTYPITTQLVVCDYTLKISENGSYCVYLFMERCHVKHKLLVLNPDVTSIAYPKTMGFGLSNFFIQKISILT